MTEQQKRKVVTIVEEDAIEMLRMIKEYEELKSGAAKVLVRKLDEALGAAKYCCDAAADAKLKQQ